MRSNDFNHSYGNCSVDWFFSLVLEWTKQWVEQYYFQWLQVLLAQLMLLKRTRRNNPQFFYKNSYKEINLERKHFPFLTYHKTKRDLNDEHIRQISFIIHTPKSIKNPVKTLKNGVPDRSRTYDLSLRRRMLYPTELLGHIMILTQFCKINDCFYMVFFKHLLIVWIY